MLFRSVTVEYKPVNGKRISVEVSPEVKDVLEETDRKLRSQGRDIYKYLNKKVSKLFSIIFAILLFALILYLIIIASKMSDGISYPNILFSGFHSVIISVVVLCVTQVAGTFMLRLQDGK